MICKYCGNEIRDDAKFCPHCGAVSGAAPEAAVPPAGPEAPAGGGKKKGLLIAGAVAAVALLAALAAVAGGLFSNPKRAVEAAAVKSAAAYAQASEGMGLPDLSRLSRAQSYSQRFVLGLNSVNSMLTGYDMSALSGLGLRMDTGVDIENRKLDFELAAFWDEEDLIRFLLTADDAELYFSSPQITGETCYGVNTETLGADLEAMTGDSSAKDMSFNFFELVETVMEEMDPEELERSGREAAKALWGEAQVKKLGSETLDINGVSTKTASYRVSIPRQALERYGDALAQTAARVDYVQLYEKLFREMGLPQEELKEFIDQLEDLDPYGELADDIRELAGEIGDLELRVRLSGGYVSAVTYQGELYGSQVKLNMYLGGGERYVDDLSLELDLDGKQTAVKSSGDHGGRGGAFTDQTTLRSDVLRGYGSSITSEFRYEPGKTADNLSWKLELSGAGSLKMTGQLTAGEDSLELTLEDLSLRVMGLEVCSLRMEYGFGPYRGVPRTDGAKIVPQMNEQELMQMVLDTQRRTLAWASETQGLFRSRLPAELYAALFR